MNPKCAGPLNLLTALIWGEARGEPFEGKMAVAFVARNRMGDSRWPDTWEEVILQRRQFSCFNKNDLNYESTLDALLPSRNSRDMDWRECRLAAHAVLYSWHRDVSKGANHFYSNMLATPPKWASKQIATVVIGRHKFFTL